MDLFSCMQEKCTVCLQGHFRGNIFSHSFLGLIFFLILGLQIFFQNIKVGGGKKIKIKITKKNCFILSETYLDRRKKNNKICMILHCKNAEMAIF